MSQEESFVSHLVELRDRLLYCLYGLIVAAVLLAFWPGDRKSVV